MKTLTERYICLHPVSDALALRKHWNMKTFATCFHIFVLFREAYTRKLLVFKVPLFPRDTLFGPVGYRTRLVHMYNLNPDGHLEQFVKYFPQLTVSFQFPHARMPSSVRLEQNHVTRVNWKEDEAKEREIERESNHDFCVETLFTYYLQRGLSVHFDRKHSVYFLF